MTGILYRTPLADDLTSAPQFYIKVITKVETRDATVQIGPTVSFKTGTIQTEEKH